MKYYFIFYYKVIRGHHNEPISVPINEVITEHPFSWQVKNRGNSTFAYTTSCILVSWQEIEQETYEKYTMDFPVMSIH